MTKDVTDKMDEIHEQKIEDAITERAVETKADTTSWRQRGWDEWTANRTGWYKNDT